MGCLLKKMHPLPLGRCTGQNTKNHFMGAKGIAEQLLMGEERPEKSQVCQQRRNVQNT